MLFLNIECNDICKFMRHFHVTQTCFCSHFQVNHRLPYSARWSVTLRPSLSAIIIDHSPWRRVQQLPKWLSWDRMTTLCRSWGACCFIWTSVVEANLQWQLKLGCYHQKTQTSFFFSFSFSSLNRPFGSGIVTPSGILLNSQILDFSWPNKTKNSSHNPVIVYFVLC